MALSPGSTYSVALEALEVAGVPALSLGADGRVIEATGVVRELLGHPQEDLAAREFTAVLADPAKEAVIQEFFSNLQGGDEPSHLHLEATVRPGSEDAVPVGVSLGVAQRSSSPREALAVFTDLRPRQLLERKAHSTQKFSVVGTYAAGIAHDFNNMLTVVAGNAELALVAERPEESQENIRSALDAAQAATGIVRKLFNFLSPAKNKVDLIDTGYVLSECVDLLGTITPSHINVRSEIDYEAGPIRASIADFQQIIVNLFTNARQALELSGGNIEIVLSRVSIPTAFDAVFPDLRSGDHVQLVISDDGPGMTPQVRERAFEPFFTTRSAREGSGLGLAVVQDIVRSMEGQVGVSSERGKGCTVMVELPVAEGIPERSGNQQGAAITFSGERVLLVDDDEDVLEVASSVLRKSGCDVVAVRSAAQAIEKFEESAADYDLVLTDLTMPRLTGVDLIFRLRYLRPEIKIGIMTGYVGAINWQAIQRQGVAFVLEKPFSKSQISAAVAQALDVEGAPEATS